MSDPLWTSNEAKTATGGALDGPAWQASGVSIDTRTLEPGDLFVALKDIRDGHEFAADALKKGAAAVMVSDGSVCEGPKLVVPDVLAGLEALGQASIKRCEATRIGVTGSVGKTSVKEMIAAVLRLDGPAHWSVKSYNNHWGVPLTLSRMPQVCEGAVFEIGMNHAGEIRSLTAQVKPHVALITKIAPAHLEQLGSMEAIADAKAEIFEGLVEDGIAVIPADDDFASRLAGHVSRSKAGFMLDFGRAKKAAVRIIRYEEGDQDGHGLFDVMGRQVELRVGLPGAHQGVNASAVLASCLAAGYSLDTVADALDSLTPQAGRGEIFRTALSPKTSAVVIDDSYNANPASMGAAIESLAHRKPKADGRKIAILGEMLELGPKSVAMHAALADPLKRAKVDHVIGVGEMMNALIEALPDRVTSEYARTPEEALASLENKLRAEDIVLIKGSNASGVHRIVASLRKGRASASAQA